MTYKYIKPISSGVVIPETKNDCTIRAVANATGISYDTILRFCKENLSYKEGKGLFTKEVLTLFKEFGLTFLGSVGTTKQALFFKKYTEDAAELPGATVEKALKIYSQGTYIFCVTGHVFCVKDANIIDIGGSTNKNLRVVAVWKF